MCVCVHVRAPTGGLVKMKRNPCQNRLYSRSLSPLLPSVVVFHKTARGGLRHFSLNRASERIWRIKTYLLSWICISNGHRRARPSVTLRVWRSRSARINCTSTEQINRVACFTISYCCCCRGCFYFYRGQRSAAVFLLCLRESRENSLHKTKEHEELHALDRSVYLKTEQVCSFEGRSDFVYHAMICSQTPAWVTWSAKLLPFWAQSTSPSYFLITLSLSFLFKFYCYLYVMQSNTIDRAWSLRMHPIACKINMCKISMRTDIAYVMYQNTFM